MTISVTVAVGGTHRAKVTRSDGVETFVEPGTTQGFAAYGDLTLTIAEVELASSEDDAQPRSGGSGHGVPGGPKK